MGPPSPIRTVFALHAWRGMPIPRDFVSSLTDLTPDRISSEENAELRRVMLEIFGYDRYLAETGARPLHRDETGVLWSIDLPGDESVVMVEVVNSTPEPDGTHRTYYLRVPPGTPQRARGRRLDVRCGRGRLPPRKTDLSLRVSLGRTSPVTRDARCHGAAACAQVTLPSAVERHPTSWRARRRAGGPGRPPPVSRGWARTVPADCRPTPPPSRSCHRAGRGRA